MGSLHLWQSTQSTRGSQPGAERSAIEKAPAEADAQQRPIPSQAKFLHVLTLRQNPLPTPSTPHTQPSPMAPLPFRSQDLPSWCLSSRRTLSGLHLAARTALERAHPAYKPSRNSPAAPASHTYPSSCCPSRRGPECLLLRPMPHLTRPTRRGLVVNVQARCV